MSEAGEEEEAQLELDLGDLDLTNDQVDLNGLEEALKLYEKHDIVRDVLRTSEGGQLRERAAQIESKLHQARSFSSRAPPSCQCSPAPGQAFGAVHLPAGHLGLGRHVPRCLGGAG